MSQPATYAAGVRLPYAKLPAQVQGWIEDQLGAPVISAEDKRGGFSPGVAAVATTASGQSAFIKAVGGSVNTQALHFYQMERDRTVALPDLPGLLKPLAWTDLTVPTADDPAGETWAVTLFPTIDGSTPRHAWSATELDRVLDALQTLTGQLTPSPWPASADLDRDLVKFFNGWQEIAANPDAPWRADPWVLERLDEFVRIEQELHRTLPGTTLSHTDLRADNILLADDQVWFVDWAHARNAAPWVDRALLLCDVIAARSDRADGGEIDIESLISGPDARQTQSMIVGLAGAMRTMSIQPPPPGLPTIRPWQLATGDTLLAFIKRGAFDVGLD